MNKKDIEDIVLGLVEAANSRNLRDIINHLGIDVINVPNMKEQASYINNNGKEVILLSTDTPDEIKDFILAHEIGHAVLHNFEIVHFSTSINKKSRLEREADYFAFCLLDLEIEEIEGFTFEDYSKVLGINEEIVKYIVK